MDRLVSPRSDWMEEEGGECCVSGMALMVMLCQWYGLDGNAVSVVWLGW